MVSFILPFPCYYGNHLYGCRLVTSVVQFVLVFVTQQTKKWYQYLIQVCNRDADNLEQNSEELHYNYCHTLKMTDKADSSSI